VRASESKSTTPNRTAAALLPRFGNDPEAKYIDGVCSHPGDLAGIAGWGQGCSTLWNAEEVEEAIEPADSGAEAVLSE
jgi:hypothetical protein